MQPESSSRHRCLQHSCAYFILKIDEKCSRTNGFLIGINDDCWYWLKFLGQPVVSHPTAVWLSIFFGYMTECADKIDGLIAILSTFVVNVLRFFICVRLIHQRRRATDTISVFEFGNVYTTSQSSTALALSAKKHSASVKNGAIFCCMEPDSALSFRVMRFHRPFTRYLLAFVHFADLSRTGCEIWFP